MNKLLLLRAVIVASLGLTVIAETEQQLPTSVVHVHEGGKHSYTVGGIFAGFIFKSTSETGSFYTPYFPDSLDVSVDRERRTFTVSTSRPLSIPELQNAIDKAANEGGDFPYWTELQLRDTPKSPSYADGLFRVRPLKGEHPLGLAWFCVAKDGLLRFPIGLAFDHQGTVLVSKKTAYCMCHERYAIRILDADGRLLWQEQEVALASCRFAVVDKDGDGVHEILIDREDHGKSARFVIRANHALPLSDAAVTPAASTPQTAPTKPSGRARGKGR